MHHALCNTDMCLCGLRKLVLIVVDNMVLILFLLMRCVAESPLSNLRSPMSYWTDTRAFINEISCIGRNTYNTFYDISSWPCTDTLVYMMTISEFY